MTEAIGPWTARGERKRALYADDPYYWEGLAAFRDGLAACSPARLSAGEIPSTVTFLLVKPEAIAGRRTGQILDFVQAAGFLVAGGWPVRMGRHETRNLWRYSLNSVPTAHIRALEMLVSAGPLFLLGLRRAPDPGQVPWGPSAAELLSAVKGSSSNPDAPATLRRQLGCPALMLNFVHAPDEPADVLRELSVLCEPGLLGRVVRELIAAAEWPPARFDAAAREAAATLAAQCALSPSHDLDIRASLKRLRDTPGSALPAATLQAIRSGRVSQEQALDVVRSLELAEELPRWDRVVAAAHLVDGLRTGRAPLIGLRRADEREQRYGGEPVSRLDRLIPAPALEDAGIKRDRVRDGRPQQHRERAVQPSRHLVVDPAGPQVKAGAVMQADGRGGQLSFEPYFLDPHHRRGEPHELVEALRVVTRRAVPGSGATAQFDGRQRVRRRRMGDRQPEPFGLPPVLPQPEPCLLARDGRHELLDTRIGADIHAETGVHRNSGQPGGFEVLSDGCAAINVEEGKPLDPFLPGEISQRRAGRTGRPRAWHGREDRVVAVRHMGEHDPVTRRPPGQPQAGNGPDGVIRTLDVGRQYRDGRITENQVEERVRLLQRRALVGAQECVVVEGGGAGRIGDRHPFAAVDPLNGRIDPGTRRHTDFLRDT